MAKKVFVGEDQNFPQLVADLKTWLQQKGFEVQSVSEAGAHLIQARKESTWRTLLGNNQTLNVKITGTPAEYTLDLDAGTWLKNLKGGGSALAGAIGTWATAGISAAWSAVERTKLEADLWAVKDAWCRHCKKIGAAQATGEKLLRTENVSLLPSGDYQGTRIFTDTFKCVFCAGIWEQGEKPRQVLLCPKCLQENTREATGEQILGCEKTDERGPAGQPLGRQRYTNTSRCRACGHGWNDGEKTRLVEVCPHCLKAGTREFTGERLLRTESVTLQPSGDYQGSQVFTDQCRCTACGGTWEQGEKARTVLLCPKCHRADAKEATGEQCFRTEKTGQTNAAGQPLGQQVYTNTFRCRHCGHAWNDGQKTRLVEVCPECLKPDQRELVGEHPLVVRRTDRVTDDGVEIGEQVITRDFRCRSCGCTWSAGEARAEVELCAGCLKPVRKECLGEAVVGQFERPTPAGPVVFEVFTVNYRCSACGHPWDLGKRARKR